MTLRFPRHIFPVRRIFREALFRIKGSDRTAFLTFDDGPHTDSTPELLGILDKMNVRAVFFCSGEAAENYPDLVNDIKRRGHIIGNHGYYHFNGWRISTKEFCDNAQKASPFTSSTLFRPPYGRIRITQYNHLKKTFKIVFWDIMCYDFDINFGADRSLQVLNQKLRPGSIIVLHDTPDSTCRYFLKDFIEISTKEGYSFRTL